MESNAPGLAQDVLQRAFKSTLESTGETFWTMLFAALCAAGVWWLRCRREGRSFRSFPSGWKQKTVDSVVVAVAALGIIFIPRVIVAIHDRDGDQQATIKKLSDELLKKPDISSLPIVAENPDHADLLTRLRTVETELTSRKQEVVDAKLQLASRETQLASSEARIRELERDLTTARQRTETERGRFDEAQRKLAAATAQQTQCDQLATVSGTGRQLVTKLRSTRAAPETRREIDQWYEAVCSILSRNQCEAFLNAPLARDSWNNYPSDDGGYSHTLRGRSEFLSSRLSSLCR